MMPMSETCSCCLPCSLLALSTQVASLERERDDAVAKLESAQRKAERAARDWQLERQSYEVRAACNALSLKLYECVVILWYLLQVARAPMGLCCCLAPIHTTLPACSCLHDNPQNTIRGLKSNIAELEANLSTTRAEASTTRRQADAVGRELAAARAQRQQAEAELRQQVRPCVRMRLGMRSCLDWCPPMVAGRYTVPTVTPFVAEAQQEELSKRMICMLSTSA